eukprot:GDKI01044844.1.p1 GENE.GDKI01044844.1~~GDKI01044844.1.p1  ORF type:complete len:148 (+),score=25.04 GDKI01044844.1:157-600(+)
MLRANSYTLTSRCFTTAAAAAASRTPNPIPRTFSSQAQQQQPVSSSIVAPYPISGHFDLAVIGAGPAGLAGPVRSKRVLLVNKRPLGRASLTNGALSSKVMWQLSRQHRHAQNVSRRYDTELKQLDYQKVTDAVRESVEVKLGVVMS